MLVLNCHDTNAGNTAGKTTGKSLRVAGKSRKTDFIPAVFHLERLGKTSAVR